MLLRSIELHVLCEQSPCNELRAEVTKLSDAKRPRWTGGAPQSRPGMDCVGASIRMFVCAKESHCPIGVAGVSGAVDSGAPA